MKINRSFLEKTLRAYFNNTYNLKDETVKSTIKVISYFPDNDFEIFANDDMGVTLELNDDHISLNFKIDTEGLISYEISSRNKIKVESVKYIYNSLFSLLAEIEEQTF